jgi:hypothetical protein
MKKFPATGAGTPLLVKLDCNPARGNAGATRYAISR